MALITCPECGKEYSDKAPACIHCGCPTEKQEVAERKALQPIPETVGYLRKTISGATDAIFVGSKAIDVNTINGVKLCRATFTSNGFITICTKDGAGHNVTNAKEAAKDENSILFNQLQNATFEKIATEISGSLGLPLNRDVLTTTGAALKSIADEQNYQQERVAQLKRDGVVFCPRCKSTSITYQSKKLSLGRASVGGVLAGGAGAILGGQSSKKGYNKCMNCGHKWKI